mmetsp:Transcript_13486/g.36514  ORF Transcript_13486/g.36514 Transcript_13486/m.36514 type:complete len:332 (-) Transcript_13486:7594-8589(-)
MANLLNSIKSNPRKRCLRRSRALPRSLRDHHSYSKSSSMALTSSSSCATFLLRLAWLSNPTQALAVRPSLVRAFGSAPACTSFSAKSRAPLMAALFWAQKCKGVHWSLPTAFTFAFASSKRRPTSHAPDMQAAMRGVHRCPSSASTFAPRSMSILAAGTALCSDAWWRYDLPSSHAMFKSAPPSNSAFATSTCPLLRASQAGVFPESFSASSSLFSNSTCTHSRCPCSAATCKAVFSSSSVASGSASLSNKRRTQARWPRFALAIRAVPSWLPLPSLISFPAERASCSPSASPNWAAETGHGSFGIETLCFTISSQTDLKLKTFFTCKSSN